MSAPEMEAMDRQELARLLALAAFKAYYHCYGGSMPLLVSYRERCCQIAPGDLVFETSMVSFDPDHPSVGPWTARIGRFVERKEEPLFDDWDEKAMGKPCPRDTFIYIRDLDGVLRHWRNCKFLAIPTHFRFGQKEDQCSDVFFTF